MTIDNQLKLAEQFTYLWKGLLPSIGVPGTDQFLLWAGKYSEEIVLAGINRAARKARKMRDSAPMTLTEAVQYASSVMRNELLNVHRFPNGQQQKEGVAA